MDWKDIKEEMPKVGAAKLKVRDKNGTELNAFYYEDAMSWASFYGQKSCHWWNAHDYTRIENVTHWKS